MPQIDKITLNIIPAAMTTITFKIKKLISTLKRIILFDLI
ncbi:hypothetical protein HMPREF3186_01545 [Gemella haemolysans]|uniref:Uncharacterized protein n=1 Tax=Gemella haemolysans TaxID=1379 RepID=A0A133ZR49_9BACL|nr:hypothetical protein HMPREF3186_01545 [Gemella haemolysans]